MRRALLLLALLAAPALAHGGPDYVGSEACVACHADAATAWEGSHHALAWTLPSPETVVADFDGTVFELDGMVARFRIEGDAYHVAVTEKDGVTTDYRVHSVAGIAPLQQYLLETAPGRLQSFDVVWDTEAGGWFHLYPEQDLPPGDGLHWTGPYKTWNARCAECHATGYEKSYDPTTRSYASTQAEIGVGCEACHGAGQAHLDWAEDTTQEAPDGYGFSQPFTTTEATIQQCATCHSRREAHDDASAQTSASSTAWRPRCDRKRTAWSSDSTAGSRTSCRATASAPARTSSRRSCATSDSTTASSRNSS